LQKTGKGKKKKERAFCEIRFSLLGGNEASAFGAAVSFRSPSLLAPASAQVFIMTTLPCENNCREVPRTSNVKTTDLGMWVVLSKLGNLAG